MPRDDLLDFTNAVRVHGMHTKNHWSNSTWVEMNGMDTYLFPYAMDIFKGENILVSLLVLWNRLFVVVVLCPR